MALAVVCVLVVVLAVTVTTVSAAASVSVNTTAIHHLDWVRASFSGIELAATATAWLGVYCPASANVSMIPKPKAAYSAPPWTASYPLKYVMCSQIPSCVDTGSGFVDFRLENVFQDCKVSLFTGDVTYPQVVAESAAVSFKDLDAPMKGHLARTPSNTEMMVVWSTRLPSDQSQVRWSFHRGGPYVHSAVAETKTHTEKELCGEPATAHGYYPPFYWHYATINHLRPGQDIVYYIYGSEENGWSEEASFKALPAVGPDSEVSIAIVADLGVTEFENNTLTRLNMPNAGATMQALADHINSADYEYSLLLHGGDIAYSCGYLIKWESYMSQITDMKLASKVPYVMNQGNHERDFPDSGSGSDLYPTSADSGGECGVPTELRFPSPTNASYRDSGWYSFVQGPALIVMMNSEAQVAPGSAQYAFLESTFQSMDRSNTPWLVVASHRPMYYVYSKGGKIDPIFQVIEDLFYKYQVDLFIVGHVHNTYRSCAVLNGTCIEPVTAGAYDAPVHAGVGNGGVAPLDVVGNETNTPAWVKYQASEYGFASMKINRTHLEFVYFNNASVAHHTANIYRSYPRNNALYL